MEIDLPVESFNDYITRIEREKRDLQAEIERCHREMKKTDSHKREVHIVWGHFDHIKNYARKLEEENIELKLENERLINKQNSRKAIFIETEEQEASHKRFKKEVLETEQKRKRPADWNITSKSPSYLSMLASETGEGKFCTECKELSVAYKTEHFFCKEWCYTSFYNRLK